MLVGATEQRDERAVSVARRAAGEQPRSDA